MKKILSLVCVLCLFLAFLPHTAAARTYDPIIKVGLSYDSKALPAANLQNYSGMDIGYAFGYFDEDREFVSTYEIDDENKITVLKNTNLWLSGTDYSDTPLANYSDTVGAYCLQIDEYFDLDDALDVLDEVEDEGYDAYLCYTAKGFRVRIGQYMSGEDANAALERVSNNIGWELERRVPNGTCYTVVVTGTSHILYQFDMLGEYPLGIMPFSQQTWFKGYRYYGGFEYNRVSGNNINVINVVGLTDYIKGVIPYEISPSWPIEAQKAQALCAKCYTVNNLSKHRAKGFDLCNTTDCQVYYGTGNATEVSDSAVEAVDGLFVLYDGKICQTYYHASSGGYTEDCGNIWGKDIPYLKAVEDTYLESMRPFSFTANLSQISWILQTKGYVTQDVTDVYVSKYSDVGNVLALTVELEDGSTKTFTGDRARTALNSSTLGFTVGSHRYTINGNTGEKTVNINGKQVKLDGLYVQGDGKKAEKIDLEDGVVALTANGIEEVTITQPQQQTHKKGEYTITGTGSGHNIGLSQEGAKSMAKEGFHFEEIIKFYFTDVEVDYYDPN